MLLIQEKVFLQKNLALLQGFFLFTDCEEVHVWHRETTL